MRNGSFWAHQFESSFIPEIDAYVSALHERLLPAFSDLQGEAEKLETEIYAAAEKAGAGDEYADPAMEWEHAHDFALSHYLRMSAVAQGLTNLWGVGLYHLFEQHLLLLINHELIEHGEAPVRSAPVPWVKKHLRESTDGIDLERFASWPRIEELGWLANCVKHAEGDSCEKLRARRTDLFTNPSFKNDPFPYVNEEVESPLMGVGLFLTPEAFDDFANAVRALWRELGSAIT